MPEAVIIDAVRTPIGRHAGCLSSVRPDDLAAKAIAAAVHRVLASSDVRASMRKHASDWVADHDWDKVGPQFTPCAAM